MDFDEFTVVPHGDSHQLKFSLTLSTDIEKTGYIYLIEYLLQTPDSFLALMVF